MKTFKNNGIAILLGYSFLILLSTSCASKFQFIKSAVVPAAEGRVKVSKDNNNNYSIDLNVKSLAEPGRLTPSQNIYLVWMTSAGAEPQNIGQLISDDNFFSSLLRASLHAVTPIKPTGFFITAESFNTTHYTGSLVVLKTE